MKKLELIRWEKIASKREELHFAENNIATIIFKNRKICIIRTLAGLYACSDLCPHAGGSLSEGFLDSRGNIVCPVHQYAFNLTHGRDTLNEGYRLKIFKILENEDGIFIGSSTNP